MFHARTEVSNVPKAAQELELYLPSSIADRVTCDKQLLNVEFTLRFAQAEMTLNDPSSQIILRGRLIKSKERHSSGQHQLTHSCKLISCIQDRIQVSADRYRSIRAETAETGIPRQRIPLVEHLEETTG